MPSPDGRESPTGVTGSSGPRRIGRPRAARPLGLFLVAVVLGVGAVQVLDLLPSLRSPFAERVTDRSGPAVLRSVRDLSRYEAASGNYQVIVDLERDAPFLPDAIRGERTLFVGVGSVDAYIDFARLDDNGITVNADRTAVTVRIPHAQLEPTRLDTKNSHVFARERGLLDRAGEFFSDNPGDQRELYVLAGQKIQEAAGGSGLRERADHNAKITLTGLLKALGFRQVTITSAPAP